MAELVRFSWEQVETETITEVIDAIETVDVKDLTIFNDDVNTFDHVIETLIKVCKHSQE